MAMQVMNYLHNLLARIAQEIPTATLAMFSKLKYVNALTLKNLESIGMQNI